MKRRGEERRTVEICSARNTFIQGGKQNVWLRSFPVSHACPFDEYVLMKYEFHATDI
jgi:hypothetical protein